MKRLFLSLVAAVLLCGLFSCEIPQNAGDNNDTNSSDDFVYGEQKTLNIHKISELNTAEYELDSAKGEEEFSSIVKNYRESYTLTPADLGGVRAYYPRVKMVNDSNYLLFYHDEMYGGNAYCSRSTDCISWHSPTKVFEMGAITVEGKPNTLKFANPDACVLDDGRIIAAAAFRAEVDYLTYPDYNGVAISFSSDNGKTWSAPETVYVGTVWEPYIMQDDNGDIYIFFTSVAPGTYLYGINNLSSGVGLVRSTDNGKTWSPNVTGAPYVPQYVMRQYTGTSPDGVKIYNDQMPVALKLNNGTIALAVETYNQFADSLKFSISYNNDRFSEDLGMERSGPTDRQTNVFNLAGPYLMQFDSGEVVLTYHWADSFKYRMADCTAENFYSEKTLVNNCGMWGSSEKISSHSAALSIGTNDYDLVVTRVYLNHTLNAKKLTPTMSANTDEWDASTDAIFLGAESQAQVSVRLAYDEEFVYLLAERIDREITDEDSLSVYFYGNNGTQYIVNMTNSEYTVSSRSKTDKKETSIDPKEIGIKAYAAIDGTKNDYLDTDNGIVYEIAVPRELVDIDGEVFYRVKLTNLDAKEVIKEDSNPNASLLSTENWAKAVLN